MDPNRCHWIGLISALMIWLRQRFYKSQSSAELLLLLSELEPTVRETPGNKEIGPPAGCRSYDFRDVQFSYPLAPSNLVLKGISLKARTSLSAPGKAVGVFLMASFF
jgi:ATP-binding cassette subfamily B (MDR/TAP) protein 1